ncbi:T-cell surface glycoprotein CD1c3 isoform X2 [Xenopus laevis]|uniref:T-cell surface glycoprotein CD1c3 isoform X2 n=1 Tax=Xenopus laevis TaxID=8355 RepID=A0A8J1KPK6_XENLA|nr:T-cell surface glycoprotein CD1c3 isoform X2 [Xenopus laevis]
MKDQALFNTALDKHTSQHFENIKRDKTFCHVQARAVKIFDSAHFMTTPPNCHVHFTTFGRTELQICEAATGSCRMGILELTFILVFYAVSAEIHKFGWYKHIYRENKKPANQVISFIDDIPTGIYNSKTKIFKYINGFGSEGKLFVPESIQTAHCQICEALRYGDYDDLVKDTNTTYMNDDFFFLQFVKGCELDTESGTVSSFTYYALNGVHFMHVDQKISRWVSSHPASQRIVQIWNKKFGIYNIISEKECHERLQKNLDWLYSKTDTPKVNILYREPDGTDPSSLMCHVTRFYPRDIDVIWYKGNISLENEQIRGETLPNADLTYQVEVVIEEPESTADYHCVVKHRSLKENELSMVWAPQTANSKIITWICVFVLLPLIAGIIICCIKIKKSHSQ